MTDTATDIVWHGDLADRLYPADRLAPHPDNPRLGDVDAIVDSIEANGVYRPLYVQKSTRHILAGSHTFAALQRLGANKVPVMWVDVDDDRARRILAVDNRASDLGTYDNQALLDLLHGLETLDGTGYTDDDLSDILVDLEKQADPEAEAVQPKFSDTAERKAVTRRIIVLDLSVDRFTWLVDALAQVCEARNVESNAAAVLLLAADFTGTKPPRESEGLDDPHAEDHNDDA